MLNDSPSEERPGRVASVAILEDERILASYLTKLVEKEDDFTFAGAWHHPDDALKEIPQVRPDLVIVDLELPSVSGDECIKILSKQLPCTAFVVLTIHESNDRVFSALRAGANGYLLKSARPRDILDGLRAARDGGAPLSPEIANMVIGSFRNSAPSAGTESSPKEPMPDLTNRERELLELFAQGMVPKEAAAELGLTYETVRGYLKKIYQKLHVRSRTEAVLRFLSDR